MVLKWLKTQSNLPMSFDDDAVNDVLKDIIEAGGVVKSIFTQEPSLEDVFIKATAEVNEDDRA